MQQTLNYILYLTKKNSNDRHKFLKIQTDAHFAVE